MGDGLVVVDYFFRLPASSGDAWSFAPGDARGLFYAHFYFDHRLVWPPLFKHWPCALLSVAGLDF